MFLSPVHEWVEVQDPLRLMTAERAVLKYEEFAAYRQDI